MVRKRLEEEIKKGPWTAEEDEIVMNFVKENGPKDWSSIRSKGLLPRTGKSCRLRGVNKLQPNLKKGCKFSAEEERLVLDLQATVGNKWAAIATYLPGRTDNDVKNFWSTRQKRLARILRSSSQPNRILKKRGKASVVDHEASSSSSSSSSLHDSKFGFNQLKSASLKCNICSCLCSENFINGANNLAPPHFLTPYAVDVNINQPPVVDVDSHTNPPLGMQCNDISISWPSTFLYPNEICFTTDDYQLLNPAVNNDVDLPIVQENHDFGMELGEQSFLEKGFGYQEASFRLLGNMAQQLNLLEANSLKNYGDNVVADYKDNVIPMPDNIFDDFSDDMLDNLETFPRSSSP